MDVGDGAGPPLWATQWASQAFCRYVTRRRVPEFCLQMGRAPCRGVASDDGVGGCGWCVAVVDGGPEIAEGRKIYMYALTKPHGSCRGSGGSDMHKQNKTQNRDIKHPTAECRKA